MSAGGDRIASAIRSAHALGRPAVAAYLTAEYPSRRAWTSLLRDVDGACDVLEVGIPFSDPMADGVTIQRTSRLALEAGASLAGTLDALAALRASLSTPIVLMSYVNPLLAYGFSRLAAKAAAAGISALVVADLPLEEQGPLRTTLEGGPIALVQMVTPVTPPERMVRLCGASQGFVYAVTVAGLTGDRLPSPASLRGYLGRIRDVSALPVLAGFGIGTREDVAALVPPADGVVVGSALLRAVERGEGAGAFLRGLVEGVPPMGVPR